jgi:hypothetical protein
MYLVCAVLDELNEWNAGGKTCVNASVANTVGLYYCLVKIYDDDDKLYIKN